MIPIVSKLTQLDVATPADGQSPIWNEAQKKWVPSSISGGGAPYIHLQPIAAIVWTINHNLGYHPLVVSEDSSNRVLIGDVEYINNNTLTITWAAANAGRAELR